MIFSTLDTGIVEKYMRVSGWNEKAFGDRKETRQQTVPQTASKDSKAGGRTVPGGEILVE